MLAFKPLTCARVHAESDARRFEPTQAAHTSSKPRRSRCKAPRASVHMRVCCCNRTGPGGSACRACNTPRWDSQAKDLAAGMPRQPRGLSQAILPLGPKSQASLTLRNCHGWLSCDTRRDWRSSCGSCAATRSKDAVVQVVNKISRACCTWRRSNTLAARTGTAAGAACSRAGGRAGAFLESKASLLAAQDGNDRCKRSSIAHRLAGGKHEACWHCTSYVVRTSRSKVVTSPCCG